MERLTGKGAKSLKEAYAKVYSEQATPDYASMSDEEFAALVKKSGNPEGLMAKRKQQQIAARENTRANYTSSDAKADQEKAKVEAENKRRAEAEEGKDPLPVPRGSQLKDPRPAVPAAPQKSARQQELDAINADKNLTPMQKWEKANPKLAAAKRERDRSRGTAQSDNPLLNRNKKVPSLRSGMPLRSPSIQSSEVSKLGPGSQRLRDNPNALRGASSATGSSTAASSTPAVQPKVQPAAQPKVQPATNPNQQSSLNNTVRSGTGGSPSGSDRVAAIRARAAAARERAMQNASPSARRTIQDLQNRRNASRNRAQGNLGRPMTVTTGSGDNATTTTYAAGTSKSDPNLAAEIKTAKNQVDKGLAIPTGDTIKTKMNPDSSLRVTQNRKPEATKKIRDSLNLF